MDEIHKLYDQQQRIGIHYAGTLREVTPRTVRMIDTGSRRAAVIYSQVDAATADATIRAEVAYFAARGDVENLEWKLFDYDQPADLKDRLAAHGFTPEEPDAVLILDLAAIPPALAQPVTHDVRRVTDPAQLEHIRPVMQAVWVGEDHDWIVDSLARTLHDAPHELSIYIAYVDGVPASYAWIDYHANSDFAGLWGGSTHPDYRRRGLYTALVGVRAREAIRLGKRYLTIDASPMSRVVLEKFGFTLLAYAWACNYRPTS